MADFDYVPYTKYEMSTHCRQTSLPDVVDYFNYQVADEDYYVVRAKTIAFQDIDDPEGTITLITSAGEVGVTLNGVRRDDETIWPSHPSTLFFPGGSGAEFGILFVSASFFTKHSVPRSTYGVPEKWPVKLGGDKEKEKVRELVKALVESYPGVVADVIRQRFPGEAGEELACQFALSLT